MAIIKRFVLECGVKDSVTLGPEFFCSLSFLVLESKIKVKLKLKLKVHFGNPEAALLILNLLVLVQEFRSVF